MNEIQKLLFNQLKKHSSNYEESAKRGIVVDDLDIDSFLEESYLELKANGLVSENGKALHKQNVISRILATLLIVPAAILYFMLLLAINPLQYLISGKADYAQKFHKWVQKLLDLYGL